MVENAGNTSDSDLPLADLLEHLTRRMHEGEVLDLDEIRREFPEHAERLGEMLPVLEFLVDLSQCGEDREAGESPVPPPQARPPEDRRGVLGDFRIVRELGAGGMGIVYEAEQISLGRRVALKVLPFATMLDPRQVLRFQNESRAAASLDHPNIVKVYSVGSDRGVHYYAMQYIEGRTLASLVTEMRRQAGLDSASGEPVLAIVTTRTFEGSACVGRVGSASYGEEGRVGELLCGTEGRVADPSYGREGGAGNLSHGRASSGSSPRPSRAHFQSIARLGLQAAEALEHAHQLGIVHRDIKPANLLVDATGQLWITDFGLARIQADSNLTISGDVLGTPRYMSPEQVAGDRRVLDHRSDIYSLGATLYELITLHPPFTETDRNRLLKRIAEQEPTPVSRSNRSVPQELGTIVLKAMAKEPNARYASARELADDLQRFLDDKPILARRPSLGTRINKWLRRHPGLTAATMVVLSVALLASLVGSVLISRAQKQALEQQAIAEANEAGLRREVYAADMNFAFVGWKQAKLQWTIDLLSRYKPQPGKEDLRGFEWYYLWSLCYREHQTLRGHTAEVCCVAFDPQGRYLASASIDGTVRIWEQPTGRTLHVLPTQRTDHALALAFSPDGSILAATAGQGTVRLWETAKFTEKFVLQAHDTDVSALAFSRRAALLATASIDGSIRLWDTTTWQEQAKFAGHAKEIRTLAFSPNGNLLASGSFDDTVKLWSVATGEQHAHLIGHSNAVLWVEFLPNGRYLASTGPDLNIILWDPKNGQEGHRLRRHDDRIHCVTFTADTRIMASCSKDETICLWEVSSGSVVNTLRGHVGRIRSVAFSADGKVLASAGADGTVRLWNNSTEQEYLSFPVASHGVRAVRFAEDGTLVACATDRVVFWDIQAGRARWPTVELAGPEVHEAVFSPDGRTLITESEDGAGRLFHVAGGTVRQIALGDADSNPPTVNDLAFSPDGRMLATSWESTISLWDLSSGRPTKTFQAGDVVRGLSFSPDGRTLAVATFKGTTRFLTPDTGQWGRTFCSTDDDDATCSVAFSPDGRLLATAGVDRVIRLWDVETGQSLRTLIGHFNEVRFLAFSPDGRTLISSSNDKTVRLWSVQTGREVLYFKDRNNWVESLAFSVDGRTLVAGIKIDESHAELRAWSATTPSTAAKPVLP
ncbi:MAG: WD40 domain-containing protein [Thermoguttaceae bacterium]